LVKEEEMDLNCWFKIRLVIKESIKEKLGLLKKEGIEKEEGEGIGDGKKEEVKKEVDLRRAIVSARGNLSNVILE